MIFISFPIEKTIIPAFTVPSFSYLTSCTPTKSNLYLANSLAAATSAPALYRLHVNAITRFLHCQIFTLSDIQNRTHFGKYLHLAFVIALVVAGETLTDLINKQTETIQNL